MNWIIAIIGAAAAGFAAAFLMRYLGVTEAWMTGAAAGAAGAVAAALLFKMFAKKGGAPAS
ncbi:MAG: hypothetical protein KIS81_00100 [Maricaulaceae bacterium]|nr:hypothetical protein [Maricaulaceae bacterium]